MDLDSLKIYGKNEVTFRPATFSPTTIEIGFPPRYIHRKLFFVQRKEETPIQISKRKLSKLFEKTEFNSSFLNWYKTSGLQGKVRWEDGSDFPTFKV